MAAWVAPAIMAAGSVASSAGGKKGGSSSPNVEYMQSPEQRQMMQAVLPLMQGVSQFGMNNMGYSTQPQSTQFNNTLAYGGPQIGGMASPGGYRSPEYNSQMTRLTADIGKLQLRRNQLYQSLDNDARRDSPTLDALDTQINMLKSMRGDEYKSLGRDRGLAPTTYYPNMGTPRGGGSGFAPPAGGVTSLGAPEAPTMPSMEGILSGIQAPMPTAEWYGNIAPEVMEGLWSPYKDAQSQLMNTLNRGGQIGNARGGYSGATGVALGELMSRGARDVGLRAWEMTSPSMMMDFQNKLTERTTDFSNMMAKKQADYDMARTEWQIPFQLLGMGPNLMPTGYVQPQANPMQGIGDAANIAGMAMMYNNKSGSNYTAPSWANQFNGPI